MKDINLENSALIVVDMQNDFLPGGSLEVPNSDTIIPIINEYIEFFEKHQSLIVFTRDWHPENHISFKENGGIWPRHCIQNTKGAEIHSEIYIPKESLIISKAFEPTIEAYSGFQNTNLHEELQRRNIKNLYICGVATDYCVLNTVIDALEKGYKVYLLVDAIKGVDIKPNDSEEAIKKMISKGAELLVFDELLSVSIK